MASHTYAKMTSMETKMEAMAKEIDVLKKALQASNAKSELLLSDLKGIKQALTTKMEAEVEQAEARARDQSRLFGALKTLSDTFTEQFDSFATNQQDMSVRLSRWVEANDGMVPIADSAFPPPVYDPSEGPFGAAPFDLI